MEKGKGTVKRVFTAIGNVIIWLFVIFAAVITVFTFAAQSSEDGIPAIGSTAVLTVSTDSMVPTFDVGDIIFGKKLAPEEQTSLKVGDVITFDAGDIDGDNIRDFNTHRIVEVMKDDNGGVSYMTKGDNKLALIDKKPVPSQNVICRYTGKRLKGVGKVIAFLQTSKGFLFCVVLPLILLFIFELLKFVRKFLEVKGGKQKLSAEDEARIRQQAVEEYLRSQGGAAAVATAASAESAPVEPVKEAEAPAEEPETPAEDAVEETPAEEVTEEAQASEEASAEEATEEIPAEEAETPAEETAEEAPEEAPADAAEDNA